MLVNILVAIGGLAIFATLMSVGLLIKGKELKGTCATQSAQFGDGDTCGMCGKPVGACENEPQDKTEAEAA
jgi:hypothetical protein